MNGIIISSNPDGNLDITNKNGLAVMLAPIHGSLLMLMGDAVGGDGGFLRSLRITGYPEFQTDFYLHK
jgi:hypothetical protein